MIAIGVGRAASRTATAPPAGEPLLPIDRDWDRDRDRDRRRDVRRARQCYMKLLIIAVIVFLASLLTTFRTRKHTVLPRIVGTPGAYVVNTTASGHNNGDSVVATYNTGLNATDVQLRQAASSARMTLPMETRAVVIPSRFDIVTMHSLFSGQLSKIGFGAAAGATVGYATKRVFKVALFVVGVVFLAVQGMALRGWVHVDFTAIEREVAPILHNYSQSRTISLLAHNVPFTSAFSAGCLFAFLWL